jgi:hypothetical protein
MAVAASPSAHRIPPTESACVDFRIDFLIAPWLGIVGFHRSGDVKPAAI